MRETSNLQRKKKENARNASNRQREMRARDAREQRKDNEEFTGTKRKFQRKEMLGWEGGNVVMLSLGRLLS